MLGKDQYRLRVAARLFPAFQVILLERYGEGRLLSIAVEVRGS